MAEKQTRYLVAKVALSEGEMAKLRERADRDGRAVADYMRRAAEEVEGLRARVAELELEVAALRAFHSPVARAYAGD